MKCAYCDGECREGKADYNSPVGIIVKDVPALVCEKCGEAYFREKEAKILEEIERIAKTKLEGRGKNVRPILSMVTIPYNVEP